MLHITSAWTGLLSDWLEKNDLQCEEIRNEIIKLQPDEYISLGIWNNLLQKACQLKPGCIAPGLEIGQGIAPKHAGILGYLAIYSTTLGRALQSYLRYERLFYGNDIADFNIADNMATLSWHKNSVCLDHEESTMAGIVTLLNGHMHQPLQLTRVQFAGSSSAERREACERFFGCEVRYNSPYTSLTGPAAQLMQPMKGADDALLSLLQSHADSQLARQPEQHWLQDLQALIMRRLPEGEVSQDKLAECLAISPRTLQRRLEANQTNWQQLLDSTRQTLARRYLLDNGLTLAEIALLLGYSEQSAFTRAFQRWENTTPSCYRSQWLKQARR